MEAARDDVYCLEIARRSVARAALHLGIESMTEECLDVLADILISYLERLGKTLAFLVESSGRSSAHVSILDTLNSIELCTSPAILRMHVAQQQQQQNQQDQGNENTSSNTDAGRSNAPTNGNIMIDPANGDGNKSNTDVNSFICHNSHTRWQGLANFCFGSNWDQNKVSNPLLEERAGNRRSSIGGKEGPSVLNENSIEGSNNVESNRKGWIAAYPDEIQPFPQSSWDITNIAMLTNAGSNNTNTNNIKTAGSGNGSREKKMSDTSSLVVKATANPHNLPSQIAWSLHGIIKHENDTGTNTSMINNDEEEMEYTDQHLKSLPDDAFVDAAKANSWGSIRKERTNYEVNHYANLEKIEDGNHKNSNKRKADQVSGESVGGESKVEKDKEPSNTATTNASQDAGSVTSSGAAAPKTGATGSVAAAGTSAAKGGASDSPPKKKVKIEDKKGKASSNSNKNNNSTNAATSSSTSAALLLSKEQQEKQQQERRIELKANYEKFKHYPQYVPVFYPCIPRGGSKHDTNATGKTVLDIIQQELDDEEKELMKLSRKESQQPASSATSSTSPAADILSDSFGLRSALVQLGQSYWGSGWDTAPALTTGNSNTNSNGSSLSSRDKNPSGENLRVPLGRTIAPTQQGANSTSNSNNVIVPLGRASGSRVSRILEGSMDAATMQ